MTVTLNVVNNIKATPAREIPNKHIELPLVFQTAYILKQLV